MPTFLPGVQLCRIFYTEAVKPLLDRWYPGLRHAAARVGPGSDVLGFDTARSTDHDWGPRLELFLSAEDRARHGAHLSDLLANHLPGRIRGWSTHFAPPQGRVRVMSAPAGPVAHHVTITDLETWCLQVLGFDPRPAVTTLDWLATPSQRLAEVTAGAVYHDDTGELTAVRKALRWYPDDVWRYLLAAAWTRVGQEEAFVGRTAEAGDDLGSRLIAGRLVRELMRLGLLLERRYPPYTKWLGTAFARLPWARLVTGALADAAGSADAAARQAALCRAYQIFGERQNQTRLAEPVDARVRAFHDRPYQVLDAQRFADALTGRISEPQIAALAPIGALDQFTDSADVTCRPALARAVARAAYRRLA